MAKNNLFKWFHIQIGQLFCSVVVKEKEMIQIIGISSSYRAFDKPPILG